jgi:hypothetical protein
MQLHVQHMVDASLEAHQEEAARKLAACEQATEHYMQLLKAAELRARAAEEQVQIAEASKIELSLALVCNW